jgi:hypothetical protein
MMRIITIVNIFAIILILNTEPVMALCSVAIQNSTGRTISLKVVDDASRFKQEEFYETLVSSDQPKEIDVDMNNCNQHIEILVRPHVQTGEQAYEYHVLSQPQPLNTPPLHIIEATQLDSYKRKPIFP